MSITVADCLKLSILADAKVVAGENGLNRIVESVTVFEFDGFKIESLSNVLVGNEMVIGAFSYFKNRNRDELLQFFSRIIQDQISCVIVFYLTDILGALPKELLALAEAQGTPVIVMPDKGQFSYSYADVIMSVSEAIIYDKRTDAMFISDVISRLLSVEEHKQNNQTLLDFLSEEVQSELILADDTLTPFVWSLRGTQVQPHHLLREASNMMQHMPPMTSKILRMPGYSPPLHLRLQPFRAKKTMGFLIAMNPIEKPFKIDAITQSAEVLRLFMSFWRFSSTRMSELTALLEGRTAKSKIQSKIKHIAVIRGEKGASLNEIVGEFELTQIIREYDAHNLYNQFLITYFDGSIVVAGYEPCESLMDPLQGVFSILERAPNYVVGECNVLANRTVRQVYSTISRALPLACKVFSRFRFFDETKIQLTNTLHSIYQGCMSEANTYLEILLPLQRDKEWARHFETLSALYLHCGGSLYDAAAMLHLHVNTVKYRLQRIESVLGVSLDSTLVQSRLILALGMAAVKG